MSDFADRFAALVDQKGWNQLEASAHLGIAQSMVSDYKNGKREPTIQVLLQLSERLGVGVGELLRAPHHGTRVREAAREYDEAKGNHWFRQLRVTWQKHPHEQHRIRTAIELAWPNQAEEIIAWLIKSKT